MTENPCIFCDMIGSDKVVLENELAFSIPDKFPVNPGHHLILPRRHMENYFSLNQKEILAMHEILFGLQKHLRKADPAIKAFNIGINNGIYAGQTILHVHMHLIPRYEGDVPLPKGGVRGVIPEKQMY